jgi:hypothetical protein
VPLIGTKTAEKGHCVSALSRGADRLQIQQDAEELDPNTYSSPQLETMYLNSGFAIVGRLALPIPLPATHVVYYQINAGTTLKVGSVSPTFGQAGGGVELCIAGPVRAIQIRPNLIPPY